MLAKFRNYRVARIGILVAVVLAGTLFAFAQRETPLEVDPERPFFKTSAPETKYLRLQESPKTGFPDRPLAPYPSDILVRKQDIAARGLKETDFPRIKKIADNVYVFEALHQSIKTLLNDSLIIVTSDGVMVVDGHGLADTTTAMVEAIKKLTPQPIKY